MIEIWATLQVISWALGVLLTIGTIIWVIVMYFKNKE